MNQKQPSAWEAKDEVEMQGALEVLYELTTGYVLSELRQEYPDVCEKLTTHNRLKNQFTNNILYSVDNLLAELIKEYTEGQYREGDLD